MPGLPSAVARCKAFRKNQKRRQGPPRLEKTDGLGIFACRDIWYYLLNRQLACAREAPANG
jgi:hypothetical protein